MGLLNKHTMAEWADFECERQLFLKLAKKGWFKERKKTIPPLRRRGQNMTKGLGREYEHEIYISLMAMRESVYKREPGGEVGPSLLTPKVLHTLKAEGLPRILLEHQFDVSNSFKTQILPHPQVFKTDNLRPDIMVLERIDTPVKVITWENRLETLEDVPEGMVGIKIFDIKATNEENVGRKHFMEILYYQHALAHFLKDSGLSREFVVLADGNGILPNIDPPNIPSLEKLYESVVTYNWEDVSLIYTNMLKRLRKISQTIPRRIDSVPTKLQPACGRCNYLEDCKFTFGHGHEDRRKWKVDLLPYLEPSVAEELKKLDIHTLGDFEKKGSNIPVLQTPKPLYAELPLIRLKVRSLLDNEMCTPDEGEITTVSIPKHTEISICIDANLDPINDVVFNFAVFLSIFVKSGSYGGIFQKLMRLFYEGYGDEEEAIAEIRALGGECTGQDLREGRRIIQEFIESPTIRAQYEVPREGYELYLFKRAYISGGTRDIDEFRLAKNAVLMFADIVTLCTIIERVVRHEERPGWVQSPKTAVYYWSREIVSQIEDLLERNMYRLFFDTGSRRKFQYVSNWLTPSESKVKNDLQIQKVYDLRMFVETVVGYPLVLNYTWHDIWHYYTGMKVNWDFWNPHFNYMDFSMWHKYLQEEDNMLKSKHLAELERQSLIKIDALNQLRIEFQKQSKLISRTSYPKPNREFEVRLLPESYHDLAKIWYLFSKLSGTVSELMYEEYRHTFPEFAIGKLVGAKIDQLVREEIVGPRGGRKFRYRFVITGLSTNIKVMEGDLVLLVPEELRDYRAVSYWMIRIEEMVWDPVSNSYLVKTDLAQEDYLRKFAELVGKEFSAQWYIYPSTGDYWTRKLYSGVRSGILTLRNIGDSWLGRRISYLWGLTPVKPGPPKKVLLDAPEIYMYHPGVLSKLSNPTPVTELDGGQLEPNPSQREALLNSMNSILSFIQGPPGTGKSQTITMLIEQIFRRHKGDVAILVTAFSYQAMYVILDKLNELPQESSVSSVEKVFLRSVSKQRAEGARDLVRDRGVWKLDGQSRVVTKRKHLTDHLSSRFILFANPHQIYNLTVEKDGKRCFPEHFGFDYIICDEASQMPVDQFLAPLLLTKKVKATLQYNPALDENGSLIDVEGVDIETHNTFDDFTKIILVGDHNQLPPVQPVKPPRKLERVLSSIFSYYIEYMDFNAVQLNVNYRSHELIVDYTRSLGIYTNLTAHESNASRLISGDISRVSDEVIREVLDPRKVLISIIHSDEFDTAVSEMEADLTASIAVEFFRMKNPSSDEEERIFWRERLGIVAPHNAHGRLIIRKINTALISEGLTNLSGRDLMAELQGTIFSVEKFQGSDRECIIGTIGVSSKMQLEKEEEFIYQINRFNVLTSRGKSKIILIASRNFIEYIPRKREVLAYAAKVRKFVDMCDNSREESFAGKGITFRYREVQPDNFGS